MVRGEYCRRAAEAGTFAEPKTREKGPRDRSYKVHHLRLEIELEIKSRRVQGTSTLTLSPINEGLTTVELDAVDMAIHRVTLEGRGELPYDHVGGKLLVRLPGPVGPAEKLTLAVDYEATPLKGLFFIQPDGAHPGKQPMVWAQGEAEENRHWFPCYDATNDRMTSEVIITVPRVFQALSNGRLADVREDEGRGTRTFHWIMDVPHPTYLVTLAAADFDSVEEKVGEIPVSYHVPKGMGDFIPRTFAETPNMVRFFQGATGRAYPFAKYGQACVEDFTAGGMENTSLTILYVETLHPESAHPDYMSEPLVAHELAHQWFGDLVTCKSWGDLWLNEGFASYFDPLWFEHRYGRDEFDQRMIDDLEWYFDEARERYTRPIVTQAYHDPDDMFDAHTYPKGAAVLHMLRYTLGDELFFKAIRHYVAKFQLHSIETNDLKEAIEEATGRSLDWFFRQWLYRAGHPRFEVSWTWDGERSLVALTVAQKQKVTDQVPPFRLPIEVQLLGIGDGGDRVVHVEEAEQTFYLPAAGRPRAVLFDPRGWILKELKFPKEKEELLAQLGGATTVPMKIQALEGLGRVVGDPQAVAALARALREEPFWGVRRAAARALGAQGNPEAMAALVEALGREPDSRVRRGVAEALGEYREPGAFDALTTAFPREPKDYPAAAMAKAAARTKDPRAFDWIINEPLARSAHVETIRRSALEGLGELRDPRGIEVCREWSRYGQNLWIRVTAAEVLGRLGEALQDRRRDVLDLLRPLLKDREFRVRRAAVGALGKTKDPAAIPALEAVEEGEVFGQIRRAARLAVKEILKAQEAKAQRADVDKALEELRQENRELKNRMARVEAEFLGGAKRRRSAPRRPKPSEPPGGTPP